MAEVGSREQFGRFAKFSSPASLRCACQGLGAHAALWSCPTPLAPCELWERSLRGPQGAHAAGGSALERLASRGVCTGDGARKAPGREVTWIQLNSCTCLVLTLNQVQDVLLFSRAAGTCQQQAEVRDLESYRKAETPSVLRSGYPNFPVIPGARPSVCRIPQGLLPCACPYFAPMYVMVKFTLYLPLVQRKLAV